MINKLKLLPKAGWLILNKCFANSAKDYDKASKEYDNYFTNIMGKYSSELIDKLDIDLKQDVLELACGTGHITYRIGSSLASGSKIVAVDQSEGMMDVAKKKVSTLTHLNIEFIKNDMISALKDIADESFDLVVCGWAICYVNPVQFLKEIKRVLRINGKVAIIETRSDSEKALDDIFERILAEDTSYMKKYLSLNLPSNSSELNKWFTKAGITVEEIWEGEQVLPFYGVEGAMEWIDKSGAASGLIDIIDESRKVEFIKKVEEYVRKYIEAGNELNLKHTLVAGIGKK